jgi:chromosome segregation ATPase
MINYIKFKYNSFHTWYTSLWSKTSTMPTVAPMAVVKENPVSIASLTETLTEVNNMANILIDSTELAKASRTIADQKAEIDRLKGLLLNDEVNQLREALHKSNELIQKANASITKNVGMISELQRDNGKLQLNLRAANEKYTDMENTLKDKDNDISTLNQNMERIAHKSMTDVKKLKADLQLKENAISSLNAERDNLLSQLSNNGKDVNPLSKKVTELQLLLVQSQDQLTAKTKEFNEYIKTYKAESTRIKELETTVEKLNQYCATSKQTIDTAIQVDLGKNNKIKELETTIESLTPFKELALQSKPIIEESNAKIEELRNTQIGLRDTIEERDSTILELNQAIEILNGTIEDHDQTMKEMGESTINENTSNIAMEEAKVIIQEQYQSISRLTNKVEELENTIESLTPFKELALQSKPIMQESKAKIQELEMAIAESNKTNNALKDKLDDKDTQITMLNRNARVNNNTIDSLTQEILRLNQTLEKLKEENIVLKDSISHNESKTNASMGNQSMAKIADLHIKQEFIAGNYEIIRNMVQTIYEYKTTINKVNELEQSIFVLEAQATDYGILYSKSKKQNDLANQRLSESYANDRKAELTNVNDKLLKQEKNLNILIQNIDINVQKFNEDSKNINEQITTAAQRLNSDIKPLTPIERLTFDPAPSIDMKAIKAKYTAMISESMYKTSMSSAIPKTSSHIGDKSRLPIAFNATTLGLSGQTVSMPPLGHQISPKLKALAVGDSIQGSAIGKDSGTAIKPKTTTMGLSGERVTMPPSTVSKPLSKDKDNQSQSTFKPSAHTSDKPIILRPSDISSNQPMPEPVVVNKLSNNMSMTLPNVPSPSPDNVMD